MPKSFQPLSILSKFPFWAILVIPFTTILVGIVVLTSTLSYHNSQNSVNDIAEQLLREISDRVDAHLTSFLEIPNLINKTNANIIHHQLLDISDRDAVRHYFWEEIQVYDSVTSIYMGNPEGGVITGGREGAGGSLYVMQTDNFVQGPFKKYATDSSGNLTELLADIPHFDARLRPWYQGAVERGGANWTAPYVLSTGQDLAIASSLPVYDTQDELMGVVSVDIFISDISHFLQDLEIGKTGQAYIVDGSGLLIATSTQTPTVVKGADDTWQRLAATDSPNPLIAVSANHIIDNLDGFASAANQRQHHMETDEEKYYLWVAPYHDARGLDWFIIITIPEHDFLGQIETQSQINLIATIIAVILALILGIIAAIQVSRPIARLSIAATELAQGKWSQPVPIHGVKEIRQLGEAFNTMADQLHQAFSHLEERVKERTAKLETSEARYRAIVEDQTELICRFLPDNTLTFVNDAYCRYFNKTAEELLHTSFMPSLPDSDQTPLAQQLTTLSNENQTITVEHRVIRPDGQIGWLQWVNRALFDSAGKFLELQAVGRDITENKKFEETLKKALDRETELNELKTQFISIVSHEFRTPLTVIMNATEIINRYGDNITPEKQEAYLHRIQSQVDRMTSLLEDVLFINRADRGKVEFIPESLDVAELCQAIIGEIRVTLRNTITFELATNGDCTEVILDRKLVRLILTNLISNAAKYSLPEGVVTIELNCDPTQIILTIKDQGIGIPTHARAHIFEPFYRATNANAIAGTGLGLAIVKQSIEQHHGTLVFESEVGQGTTFTVTLPNGGNE